MLEPNTLLAVLKSEHGSVTLPPLAGVSADLAAEIETHNVKGKSTIDHVARAGDGIRAAIERADETGNYGGVTAVVEAARVNKLDVAQEAVSLWAQRESLARRMADELKAQLPDAEARLEAAKAGRRKALTAAGQGVESTLGWAAGNWEAGKIQFEAMIRQNDFVRPLIAEVEDLRTRERAAVQQIATSAHGVTKARDFTRRTALAMAAL